MGQHNRAGIEQDMTRSLKEGQSGIEIMILSIFLLMIFASYTTIISSNSEELVTYQKNKLSLSIAEKIAYEINLAATSDDGYRKKFYISPDIYGKPYNVTFSERNVFVDSKFNSHSSYVIESDVKGVFIKGYNYVEKKDGEIYINPADTQMPALSASTQPGYPLHDDDIYIHMTADDTYNGNQEIAGCYVSEDEISWEHAIPDDGSYDSPKEGASYNLGMQSTGTYTYHVMCNDTDGHASTEEIEFTVAAQGSFWWDERWDYRIPINITIDEYERNDYPVHIRINFTEILSGVGASGSLDRDSLRLVEWDRNTEKNMPFAVKGKEITYQSVSYADLWDMTDDDHNEEVDFSSGLNQTANTWGIDQDDDGWDWADEADAPYGRNDEQEYYYARYGDPDGDSDYDTGTGSGIYRPDLPPDDDHLEIIIGGIPDDPLEGDDIMDSGAWGIKIYVDDGMHSHIESGGSARIRFDYYADDADDDLEEGAWIKARFGDQESMTYLGEDLDTGHAYSDPSDEIWASVNDPSGGWNGLHYGTFEQDVSDLIDGPGWYYLDIGGKVDWMDPSSNGHGTREGLGVYIDDIALRFSSEKSNYAPGSNEILDVFWLMNGTTASVNNRSYYLYFTDTSNPRNASNLSIGIDIEYFHMGYLSTNVSRMENILSGLKSDRWISSWKRTDTGTDSPYIYDHDITEGHETVIMGQSDRPDIYLDSWVQQGNRLIMFTPSRDLDTDLPVAGYSPSNHDRYGSLDTTIYTEGIESVLSRDSLSYGYVDQWDNDVHEGSCVYADEGDSQVMLSACDHGKGSFAFINYPSTGDEHGSYPGPEQDVLESLIWKLLFMKDNIPGYHIGITEIS